MRRQASIDVDTPRNPTCPHCDVTTRLYGVEDHPIIKHAELRTYVCPRCEAVETEIASDSAESNSSGVVAGGVFDAEMTRLLGSTFDAAWEALLASGRLTDRPRQAALVRELLARSIIKGMQRGETDPLRIAEDALRSVSRTH